MKHGNTQSTINRYLALLKKMFNIAVEEGYLEINPVSKIKLFSEKDNLKERILSIDEEERLIDESAPHLRSIILIALNTGMRLGEILHLKWNQVNLRDQIIVVEKTKNGRTRYIPINQTLHAELTELKNTNGLKPSIFFNEKTGKPLQSVKTAFKAACRRAEIENLRFHDLRHTFGSRLIQNGADVETVRSLLGHSSLLITQRYVHSTDERKKAAVSTLKGNTQKKTQKRGNLLHICDMKKKQQESKAVPIAVSCSNQVN